MTEKDLELSTELKNFQFVNREILALFEGKEEDNWVLQCLLNDQAKRTREVARDICMVLLTLHAELRTKMLHLLLDSLGKAL